MNRREHDSFTPWRLWPDAPPINATSFSETLDGGQAFRWNRIEDYYEGRWGRNVVRLRHDRTGIQWSAPPSQETDQVLDALKQYFALDRNFKELADALPWRSDPVLRTAVETFPGLHILRQPLGETLFGFLCSSTKQIPQIKAICEAVAQDMGDPLPDGSHALPSWEQIANASEARLRAAKLGYRARYIYQTALFLSQNPDWLEQTAALPTEAARERLISLPGVGPKIADCVLLFGMGRLEAFPIDTWVQKILIRSYGLEGWKTELLLDFARIHFGAAAGLAQQYLFAAARDGRIARP
jgi:N-glycosylase/DNA lyase